MLQFKMIFWSIALTEFTDQNNLTALKMVLQFMFVLMVEDHSEIVQI